MERNKMKLLIAIPCTEFMHGEFVKCLTKLTNRLTKDGIDFEVSVIIGTLVYIARNRLACKAINEHFTHVLWLDCDMVFGEEIVDDLLFCGKDFVTGAYVTRKPPYRSVIFTKLNPIERKEVFGTEPFRAEGCGFGIVLISTRVLEDVQMKFGNCFNPTDEMGEDLAFCWRAKAAGAELWCDPSVRAGHIAHVPIWPDEKPAYGAFIEDKGADKDA